MGLITGLLTLPLAPVRGVVWVAEQLQQEAWRSWGDPAAVQRALSEVQALRESGQIDDEEADRLEDELLQRLLPPEPPHPLGATDG
ncbi:gas vesicle protein GvpG [Pedococcus sp. 5OH_020]|jgi:Gas vesicle protein G|uniref:gas vesicle protein GvpG n=1 Tax=Pedococcus sp. 5OH_020 TaxID=2989814 RepID=UPI0022E9BF27|nr:gas vesicle protein GvpG [Pedococcus sp. 5OH_020]